MFPQSSQGYQRMTARLLPYLALLIGAFVLLSRQSPVEASAASTMPAHVQQAVSPLAATPALSATVPLRATPVISAQNEISKLPPFVYETSFTNLSQTFIPNALIGITYKAGVAQPFDVAALNQMKAKMPANLCQSSPDEFACMKKREQYWLSNEQVGIRRDHAALSIPVAANYTVVLTDVVGTGGGGWASYIYAEYIPALNQHHVTVAYYEGKNEILINAKTGETTVLPYVPVISSDHKRFVTAGQMYGSPLNVQIWNTQRPHLNLEADMSIENLGDQRATKITWVDSTRARIDTADSSNQITGTIMLDLSPQGWQVNYNGQKIYAPALHPQSIVNSSTVFGIDTVGVGKRVYTDRAYKFKTVPTVVNGQQYLLFANNNMRNTDANYVQFTLAQPATIYVAFDIQASELPGWLHDGWAPTPDILSTDDVVKLRLYKKTFATGDEVSLGGNWMLPASGVRSHYLVVVVPN